MSPLTGASRVRTSSGIVFAGAWGGDEPELGDELDHEDVGQPADDETGAQRQEASA